MYGSVKVYGADPWYLEIEFRNNLAKGDCKQFVSDRFQKMRLKQKGQETVHCTTCAAILLSDCIGNVL